METRGGQLVNTTLERSTQQSLKQLTDFVSKKAALYGMGLPRLEDVPPASGYRIGGMSLEQLIDAANSFGERFAICSESNKLWGRDRHVEQFPTTEGPTYHPLTPADFRRHTQLFSLRSYQETEEICQKNGGQITSVEEFFDFLIDYLFCSAENSTSPLKRINELISPSSSPGEQRSSFMIRCRNVLYPQNPRWSLCVKLHRDASVSIVDWPMRSATADVGSLCTWRAG